MQEPTVWMEMAKQVPSLAVLVGLVYYFLTHLKSITDSHNERVAQANESCERRLSEHAHAARESSERLSKIIEANTLMLGKVGK